MKLTVGKHPLNQQDFNPINYDTIINVSDLCDINSCKDYCAKGILHFWFPLGEAYGFPLENIYGALKILWESAIQDKVYLHCMAGRNRSVTISDCYHYLKTGEHRAEPNQLFENIRDNQLPGIYRMDEFLDKCKEVFRDPSIAEDAFVDWLKRESIYL